MSGLDHPWPNLIQQLVTGQASINHPPPLNKLVKHAYRYYAFQLYEIPGESYFCKYTHLLPSFSSSGLLQRNIIK
jgi:hypothetical protein